jgi:hypothetical protein
LNYEEVAEVLECSVGTVKSRILRGRRALKQLLDPLLGQRVHERAAEALAEPAKAAASTLSANTHANAFVAPRIRMDLPDTSGVAKSAEEFEGSL